MSRLLFISTFLVLAIPALSAEPQYGKPDPSQKGTTSESVRTGGPNCDKAIYNAVSRSCAKGAFPRDWNDLEIADRDTFLSGGGGGSGS